MSEKFKENPEKILEKKFGIQSSQKEVKESVEKTVLPKNEKLNNFINSDIFKEISEEQIKKLNNLIIEMPKDVYEKTRDELKELNSYVKQYVYPNLLIAKVFLEKLKLQKSIDTLNDAWVLAYNMYEEKIESEINEIIDDIRVKFNFPKK